jgi:O-antigen/teichoic acid export membrane protein
MRDQFRYSGADRRIHGWQTRPGGVALTRSPANAGETHSLGTSAARNAALTLGGQGARFLLQLASVVVLARLLTETDYGLIGMVWAIIGVGHILKDFGLGAAAIQARDLTRGQRDNLFWLNAGAGLILTSLCLAAAPLIAAFYRRDDLAVLVWWLAPTLLLSGMTTQYRADLTRRLKLGRVAAAEIASTALGLAAGVGGAILGWGPGALIAQQLVGGVLAVVLLVVLAGWIPRWYKTREPMRQLFGFGLPVFGAQMLTYLVNNADAVIIGRMFGPVPVGLYNRGLQVVRVPMSQLRGPLDTLSLSVLSRLHDNDDRFLRFVRRGQLVMAYPLLAAAGGLIAAAPAVVDLALGARWADSAIFIQLLALGEGMTSLAAVGGWIYSSRGHALALMKFTAVSATVRLAFALAGSLFGPVGVAAGFALAHACLWPVSLWWVGRISGLPTGGLILAAIRVTAICALPSFLTWGSVIWMNGLTSAVVVPVAVTVHLAGFALLWFLPLVRKDYREILATVRMARASK